jgi:cytochrome bd ubiquinol oxidase subunit II
MALQTTWFWLIAVLWAGYFVLEGFDFGVGMLLRRVGRDDGERRVLLDAIGPVWDGNEVWLVVAAGATFAAFPLWYASMFSALYPVLVALLVCLIVRAISFDWIERGRSARWRNAWRWGNTIGSVGAPLLWGIALATLLGGVPLDGDHHFAGDFGDLVRPYPIVVGVAVVALFALHGAVFLTLRTSGALRERAAAVAGRAGLVAAPLLIGALAWTVAVAVSRNDRTWWPVALPAAAGGVAVVTGAVLARGGARPGWAFGATALAAVAVVGTLFCGLYPRVMVSHPDAGNSLTVADAAAGHYALSVITVVAAICTPVVLLYQGWTYHVFRGRVGGAPSA